MKGAASKEYYTKGVQEDKMVRSELKISSFEVAQLITSEKGGCVNGSERRNRIE